MTQEKWSSKEAAKAGQKFRREARAIFADYEKGLKTKLEDLRIIVRPKPRWIYRPLWLWFADIFIDLHTGIDKALVFETPDQYIVRKHHEAVGQQKDKVADAQEEAEWDESDEVGDILDQKHPDDLSTHTV